MPVDKFGRMSDTKTTDSGVSLTYINNNYVRSDGGTPLTGSLDMKGNTIYNVADPVNPQDVATKVYVDNTKGSGVIGRKIGDAVSIKENMDFMGKQKMKNLPDPVNDHDAATKEYVDTKTELGNIDMEGKFTVLNVKTPINDNHITDKKYVDDNAAFVFRNNEYYAKGNINLRNAKLGGLREPTQDGEATTKKYVDDSLASHFIDGNDNIVFGRDVDMEGNKIFALPLPKQDDEPATKKYVDDSQIYELDRRGNVKFDRNINLDNKRIFAMKEPKKDGEGANKKYVDETIAKKIQEEKDTFLPQDAATKNYVDEAIRGIAGGNILVSKEGVFIKDNGHYRATAPIDIDNQKVENIPDPVDEKDAVNRKYVDEIIQNLTLKQGLIRENGGFNLVDSYINMNFNTIRNVGTPQSNTDAVPRNVVDDVEKDLKEKVQKVEEKIEKRKQLIAASASYHGDLIKGDYQFTWGGQSNATYKKHDLFSGFLVPSSGYIKKFILLNTGLKFNAKQGRGDVEFVIYDLGLNNHVPLFTPVLIRNRQKPIDIGTLYIYFSEYSIDRTGEIKHFFKFNPDFEEKTLRTVEARDIINIRSEFNSINISGYRIMIANSNYNFVSTDFFTYLATVLIELDPLDD